MLPPPRAKKATETSRQAVGTKARRVLSVGLDADEEVVVDKGELMSKEMSRAVLARSGRRSKSSRPTRRSSRAGEGAPRRLTQGARRSGSKQHQDAA